MKALFIVTGRGLGGDAMTALNAMNALERRGVTCEIALDASAHGTLFEKNGYEVLCAFLTPWEITRLKHCEETFIIS